MNFDENTTSALTCSQGAAVATFQQSSMKGRGTIGYDDSGVAKPVKTQCDGQMIAVSPAPTFVGALSCNTGPNGHDAGNFACNQAVDAGHVLPVLATQVRRLTPTECERLQGFPDDYSNIPWRNQPTAPDGPRYKALGNSWAVPNVRWIGERINEELLKCN
jgi:site-specific DNA-cytosine methylase